MLSRTLLTRNFGKCFQLNRLLSSQTKSSLYELRVYNVHPKDVKSFIELSNKWMHLRLAKSPLVGYWFSEIGGINDAVHIWEYESLTDRARVRKELAEDASWVKNYIANVGGMWLRQDNSLMTLNQGTQLNTNIKPGGAYELQVAAAGAKLGHVTGAETTVVGEFQTIIGHVNKSVRLLHHSSMDSAVSTSQKALQGVTGDVHTRLMLPAPWSTLQ